MYMHLIRNIHFCNDDVYMAEAAAGTIEIQVHYIDYYRVPPFSLAWQDTDENSYGVGFCSSYQKFYGPTSPVRSFGPDPVKCKTKRQS
jgi:hypothetical protein